MHHTHVRRITIFLKLACLHFICYPHRWTTVKDGSLQVMHTSLSVPPWLLTIYFWPNETKKYQTFRKRLVQWNCGLKEQIEILTDRTPRQVGASAVRSMRARRSEVTWSVGARQHECWMTKQSDECATVGVDVVMEWTVGKGRVQSSSLTSRVRGTGTGKGVPLTRCNIMDMPKLPNCVSNYYACAAQQNQDVFLYQYNYGLECFSFTKSDLKSLDFAVKRFLMKMFRSNNWEIIAECRQWFQFNLPTELIEKKKIKFERSSSRYILVLWYIYIYIYSQLG